MVRIPEWLSDIIKITNTPTVRDVGDLLDLNSQANAAREVLASGRYFALSIVHDNSWGDKCNGRFVLPFKNWNETLKSKYMKDNGFVHGVCGSCGVRREINIKQKIVG